MGWIEKGKSAPFEHQPIEGLFFLDGDILAREFHQPWTKGQKYPTIVFPSGMKCDLWASSDPTNAIVHIFGEMDLRLNDTRDEALTHARYIAEQCGYAVRPIGEDGIEVFGMDDDERVHIRYDAQEGRMADITTFRDDGREVRPRLELLDQKTREALPPLYSGEKLGFDALAQVKFFTPDAQWTWYGSEFDGSDRFFGLVNGDELELGYFSLSELEEVRGALGLPVERDKFFHPTTLRDLKAQHEAERRGGGS